MGIGDEMATATARLAHLAQELANPRTPRGISTRPRNRDPEPLPPIDLEIIDYVAAVVSEVAAYTRAVTPAAGPIPTTDAGIYDWMHEHTAHRLGAEQQMTRDAMIIRHGLEHALIGRDRDETVIRREQCPRCACWSLFWRATDERAGCANGRCLDELGQPSVWTLKQIAEHRLAAQNARSRTAT